MQKWILIIALMVVLGLSGGSARAWNSTGHMTVALIAYRELTPEQQKQVTEILKAHPHYQQLVTETMPAGANEAEWAFMKFSTWPDWVRPARPGTDRYKSPAITRFHQGAWHYVNIPYYLGGYHGPATRPTSGPDVNILTALAENHRIFGDDNAKPEDRAVALAWLEHLVGDLHQPCHAATMYSERFPQGDQGANKQAVRGSEGPTRLHAYWDDLMGKKDASIQELDALAKQLLARKPADPAVRPEETQYDAWAKESHELAVSKVYLNGELKTALADDVWDTKTVPFDQVPAVPPKYYEDAHAIAEQRVVLAGHRLAQQIKSAIKE